MTARQEVISLSSELNSTLDDSMYDEIKCEAPKGKIWACSLVHEIISAKEKTEDPRCELWDDMLDRMSYGVEDCEDVECEWCNNI
jgi:hypothetical protein